MLEFTQQASIEANADYVWVRTYSGYGVYSPDFAAGIVRFDRNVSAEFLGQATLNALAKSRKVMDAEWHLLSEGMRMLERVRLWDQEEMAALGYKTLRAMYKDMMSVTVERRQGIIVFAPTRHDKLQAWEGFPRDDKDHEDVVIDASASPQSVGEAALLALSRCA